MTDRLLSLLMILCSLSSVAQTDTTYPQHFARPLKIPMSLSGSFGELRTNHFHMGLDIRTNARTGYAIHAAADGYVSRIKISPYGYGKVLYVDHPESGYTTVYAHLSRFKGDIADYRRRMHYNYEQNELDITVPPGALPVRRDQVIAYSGNSGSSGGPHLHFEIRETESERPVNPMLFGIVPRDRIPPQIRSLRLYTLDDTGKVILKSRYRTRTITGKMNSYPLSVRRYGRNYRVVGYDQIKAYGRIGVAVETRDKHNGSGFRLGIFDLKLSANGRLIYEFKNEKHDFYEKRFINCHIDFEQRRRRRRYYQLSFLRPGNRLSSIVHTQNNGILTLTPDTAYELRYDIQDALGNSTSLTFDITGYDGSGRSPQSDPDCAAVLSYDDPNFIKFSDLHITTLPFTFYDSLCLSYSTSQNVYYRGYSRLHTVHTENEPVHKRFRLAIRPDDAIPEQYRDRVLLVHIGSYHRAETSSRMRPDGFVEADVREFGTYYVAVDTVKPEIRPYRNAYNYVIRDRLAGIRDYNVYIDGKWVLAEYDYRRPMLTVQVPDDLEGGKHTLKVVVEDGVGNIQTYERTIYR